MSVAIDRQSSGGTPLVSIVMPSFNQASFIAAAVQSVLLQSFANLELIVADGGSTDGTLQELERLSRESGGRLRWYSEHDDGAADAINKALKLARGDYIGWLNTDDLYADGAVQRAIQYFAQHPEIIMVYGAGEHIDETGASKGAYPTIPPPLQAETLRNSCPICQPTVFFRREMLAQIGMLDTSLSASFDYDMWIRVFKRYPYRIGYIDAIQAYSRLHAACKTLRKRRDVALESMRVTSRGLGSASALWFYTWLDEFFRDFPFGPHPADARATMIEATKEARGYLHESDRVDFDQRIRDDARLRVMHDDASITMYPDGWTAPECVLRIRASKGRWTKVRVRCRHAAPKGGVLGIFISGTDGMIHEITVTKSGQFSIEIGLPTFYNSSAYWSFMIRTEGAFVPAESECNSDDGRSLAFMVDKIELEQEVGSCS
jgi:glycosyltransferase involved in cell wall biosynthesis